MTKGMYIFAFALILNYFASVYLIYTEHDKENAFYLAVLACVCVFADRLKPIIEYLKTIYQNKEK